MESRDDWSPAKAGQPKTNAKAFSKSTALKGAARGGKKRPAEIGAFDDRDKATPEELGDQERFQFSPDDSSTGGGGPGGGPRALAGWNRTGEAKKKYTGGKRSGQDGVRRKPQTRNVRREKGDRPYSGQPSSKFPVLRARSLASGPGLPDGREFEDERELARMVEAAGGGGEPLQVAVLHDRSVKELLAEAEAMGVRDGAAPSRRSLVEKIIRAAGEARRPVVDEGILFVAHEGHGFVVRRQNDYQLQGEDPYVAPALIRRYGMRPGQSVRVLIRPSAKGERCPAALAVLKVMGEDPESASKLPRFENLVPYYPLERILLEKVRTDGRPDISMRVIEILSPIGFGQRGLIVAPPRAGKTLLLQKIAESVATNTPEATLIVLLVDERPEEVNEFRRRGHGEVISSTFDEPPERHVQVAEIVFEKSRRLLEAGKDVVILLDSITRLVRAHNALIISDGRVLSGGVEVTALHEPKRFFGSARNIEGGGSLTILATASVGTGSRMDEVIFEEFQGTGNMELHLDSELVGKRIFPAINIEKTGTRKEELLYSPDEAEKIYSLRRAMQGVPMDEAMEMFIQRLEKTETNAEFLMNVNR